MMMLISINILILILLGFILRTSFKIYNKSMFSDISFLYYLFIIILPLVIGLTNIVLVAIMFPKFILLAFSPFSIPLFYFLKVKISNKTGSKKYNELIEVKEDLKNFAKELNLEIENEDIRIRILQKNRVDIIINFYTKIQRDVFKESLDKTNRLLSTNKKYNKYKFNIYLNEKEVGEKKSNQFILT
jgi:hypothetical protein